MFPRSAPVLKWRSKWNLMFVPCLAGLCIENQHCALGFVNVLLLMRLLHVSAPTCHPQGASLSS
jgi:hypothetical protein